MDKLSAFESYVAAIRAGSLSGAARGRRLSQPAISQQISALEADFGVKLLHRGRNGVQMTQAGELVYKHALAMLDEHTSLLAGLETLSETVTGRLVVTANLAFSQHVMGDVIVDLAQEHPDLDVVLRPDVQILDLAAEGIDIAIRAGSVGNGNGFGRKVAMMSILHVATPKYLDVAGRPQTPDDLINLDYIQFYSHDDQIATTLQRADETIQAPIKTGFTAQFPDLITKALYGNLGFAKVPAFLAADAIKNHALEAVLPEWQVPAKELFLVFADKERSAPRYGAFLNVLLDHLDRKVGIDLVASARQMRAGR